MAERPALIKRYGLALLATGTAVLLSLVLRPVIESTPAVLLFPAILISAWYAGTGPGILAAVLSSVALAYFFLPPYNQLFPSTPGVWIGWLIFVGVALFMSAAAAQRRQTARRAVESAAFAELAAQRAAQLQSVTAALSQALSRNEVTAVVLQQGAASVGAAAASVLKLSADGQWLERVASLGFPEAALPRPTRYSLAEPLPVSDAARLGEPIWIASAERYRAQYPALAPFINAIPFEAAAALPLHYAGRLVGALGLSFPAAVAWTPDLQSFMLTLADYCAQALERARLYEAALLAQRRTEGLQTVAAALSRALTPAQVAEVILSEGAQALGATGTRLQLLSEDGAWLINHATVAYPESVALALRRIPVADSYPATDAVRSGQAVWLHSADEYRARYPHLAEIINAMGYEATTALPLQYEDRQLGALVFSFAQQQPFDADARQYMETLADYCAQALERARLYQAAQTASSRAHQLQQLATALSSAMYSAQVAALVQQQGPRVLGEAVVTVTVWTALSPELALAGTQGAPTPGADAVHMHAPVWIESAAEFRRRYPHLVDGTAPAEALAALPLLAPEGRVLGSLIVSFAQSQPFDLEAQSLMLTLAHLCAQALERARLYEGEQAARLELEARVHERTQQLRQEISERRAVQQQLEQSREVERKRIARELHDELGGALTGLKMSLAQMRRRSPEASAAFGADLETIAQEIDETIQRVRRLATELRPAILDDFGLVAAIEWLAQDFQQRSGVTCRFQSDLEELPLAPDDATAVFRIVQESLTNIGRHAQAMQVVIAIQATSAGLALTIQDDGRGFAVDEARAGHSLGLRGMYERMEACGGQLAIDSALGQGTTITISLPETRVAS
jgi:signal transduction histidine kinase